jgi:hypothetical protein
MSFGAIARTRILRDKAGTTMAVQKWWKKARPAEGEVRNLNIFNGDVQLIIIIISEINLPVFLFLVAIYMYIQFSCH